MEELMNTKRTQRLVSSLLVIVTVTACGSSTKRSSHAQSNQTNSIQKAISRNQVNERESGKEREEERSSSSKISNEVLYEGSSHTVLLCAKSWEERPGTADYTTIDAQLVSRGLQAANRLDRPQSHTLRGWKPYAHLGVCQRARLLKPCFEKAVLKSSDWGARRFRDWAKGRVDPIRAHLALAEQETRLGGLDDVCVRGICNGIGLLQIISAFNHEGKPLASDDPEWDGITHNVLTNITFSARVIASKLVHEPEDLSSLAALYNGNPDLRALYAARVVKSYKAMKDCAI
jgi:hypothetical protein